MFGNRSWRQIVLDIEHDQAAGQVYDTKEIDLVNCYRYSLLSVDPRLIVKSIPLRFEDKDRTLYHLYLTTHNSDGALAMNNVLYKAGFQEYVLRWRLEDAKIAGQRGQLSMFEPKAIPDSNLRPSTETIAEHIRKSQSGQIVTLQTVCDVLVESPYFRDEILKAVRKLKTDGLITYNGDLTNKTVLSVK
jgi:hypothetical protein